MNRAKDGVDENRIFMDGAGAEEIECRKFFIFFKLADRLIGQPFQPTP